jgi:predicted amidophosphoribosyltransferase
MSVVLFLLMALLAALAVLYPLLPRQVARQPAATITDQEIQQAVANLRRSWSSGGPLCPGCGATHRPGDQFCVQCGKALPQAAAAGPTSSAQSRGTCPSCGAAFHPDDSFCAKCGQPTSVQESA